MTAGVFPSPLVTGLVKIILDEERLPDIDELVCLVRRAHMAGRAVAVHCVGRTALVVVLTVLADTGSTERDRIEHASVVPPDLMDPFARFGVTVDPNWFPASSQRPIPRRCRSD